MEKNLVIFIVLSLLLFSGWGYYQKRYIAPQQEQIAQAQLLAGQQTSTIAPAEPVKAAAPAAAVGKSPAGAVAKKEDAVKEESVVVETTDVKVVLTNRGAQVKSWKLKKFNESIEEKIPVELIPPDSQGALGAPAYGVVQVPYADLDTRGWKLLTAAPVQAADGSQSVAFGATLAGTPLQFKKIFTFAPQGYSAEVKIEISNPDSQQWDLKNGFSLAWGPNLGRPGEGQMANMATTAVVQLPAKVVREGTKDKHEVLPYEMPRWIALKNQYFAAVFIGQSRTAGANWTRAEIRRYPNQTLQTALVVPAVELFPGTKVEFKAQLLGTPLHYGLLKKMGLNLHRIIQFNFLRIFAWLDPLSVGMLLIMNWFYKLVGNYGVAIILLTFFVKLLLVYPSQKSMVSMRRMQKGMEKAKPRLDALRAAYKNNPQAMNAEMMKIYKEYGINPLGGCLPMLIQMPILFALYPVFYAAFELRGQGFFWRWEDLTVADPTHIMSLAMGASMFLQQKLTPQTSASADPAQAQTQKMMLYIMPIMLTGMAIWFKWPSGFLLYWGASNVFQIVQQVYVNKTVK